jgi:tripartite-type tricarboxylate transporter receptor subunit TctC
LASQREAHDEISAPSISPTGSRCCRPPERIARAQAYPTRPIRVVVGYAPAGGTDIFVRLIGQPLSDRLGQSLVIENRPGAASNIATDAVVHAAADGYTLLGFDAAAAINATLYEKLNFNFIRDIATIGIIRGPLILIVHPSVPAHSVPEFIAYAKANPGNIGTPKFESCNFNGLSCGV